MEQKGEWTNEQMDELTNKRANEQTNEQKKRKNEQTNKRTNEQTNKQTNKQTNEQTDKRTNKWMNGYICLWVKKMKHELCCFDSIVRVLCHQLLGKQVTRPGARLKKLFFPNYGHMTVKRRNCHGQNISIFCSVVFTIIIYPYYIQSYGHLTVILPYNRY